MKYLAALLMLLLTHMANATGLAIENNTLLERSLPPYDPRAPKRGLPYASARWVQNFHGPGSQTNWAYNWAADIDPTLPSSLEFVPMLLSDAADHTSVVCSTVTKFEIRLMLTIELGYSGQAMLTRLSTEALLISLLSMNRITVVAAVLA